MITKFLLVSGRKLFLETRFPLVKRVGGLGQVGAKLDRMFVLLLEGGC